MEEQILDILRRVFKDDTINKTCSQDTCKAWDSMNHLNLVIELEMEFGISLEPEEIAKMTDFNAVVQIINAKK